MICIAHIHTARGFGHVQRQTPWWPRKTEQINWYQESVDGCQYQLSVNIAPTLLYTRQSKDNSKGRKRTKYKASTRKSENEKEQGHTTEFDEYKKTRNDIHLSLIAWRWVGGVSASTFTPPPLYASNAKIPDFTTKHSALWMCTCFSLTKVPQKSGYKILQPNIYQRFISHPSHKERRMSRGENSYSPYFTPGRYELNWKGKVTIKEDAAYGRG